MIDPSRYSGPLKVALSVLAALAFLDLTLTAVAGIAPRWLHPEIRAGIYADIEFPARRVAGVVAQSRARSLNPAERLGVILGLSATQRGLDPVAFERRLGPSMRWLSLFNNGGSMNKIADQADLLAALEPRPAWVLIGINLTMLADTFEPVDPFNLARARLLLATGQLREAYQAVKGPLQARIWLLANRYRVDRGARMALHKSQSWLLRWFGEGIDVQFPPDPDPWTVDRPPLPATASEQVNAWRAEGRFDPRNYSADCTQARALVQTVRTCRALGARVVLIVMPERSTHRSLMPLEAEQAFKATLEMAFGTYAPPLLDCRASLPDDLFADNVHLNAEGRAIFSRLVADRIAALEDPPEPSPGRHG
jgi:lysophospholipase L1-like esterase